MKKRKRSISVRIYFICLALAAVGLMPASCGQSSSPDNAGMFGAGERVTPWGMALNQDGSKLYVANSLADHVSVFDTATMNELYRINVACGPRYLAFDSNYLKLYVSHDTMEYCNKSQTSNDLMKDGYVSVIDITKQKVAKEISLSQPLVTDTRDLVRDPVNNVLYVLGSKNNTIAVIDLDDDTVAGVLKNTYLSWSEPRRLRYDASYGFLYSVDHSIDYVDILVPLDPANMSFGLLAYDSQKTGFCAGSNQTKNCACSSNTTCASRDCKTSEPLPYCGESCAASGGLFPDGCTCAASADCLNGICDNNFCYSWTLMDVGNITGFCNRDNDTCYSKSKAVEVLPRLADLDACDNPADILILSDQTAYVTCYGVFSDNDNDPIYRIMWDENGLSRTNEAVATFDSMQVCDKPARMALDQTGRIVFVICYGNNKLLAIDVETGTLITTFETPDKPIDVITSSSYVFVTGSSADQIARHAIPAPVAAPRKEKSQEKRVAGSLISDYFQIVPVDSSSSPYEGLKND